MEDPNKSLEKEKTIEPNLPVEPSLVPPKVEAPIDPEYAKWVEETKDLPNAYKRYQDSSSQVKVHMKEAQKAKDYQEQITSELQTVFQRNPQLAEAIQKELAGETQPTTTQEQYAQLSPEDKALLQGVYARENMAAQGEINSFREGYKDYIQSDSEWENVKAIASAFDGKNDRHGRPFTLRTALEAAMVATHPEIAGDKAVMQRMAAMKQRDSATDFGNMPSGSSNEAPSL